MEVASVLKVSRAEEGGTELSLCKQPLRDRLGDRALSCPRQPVEPVDGLFVEIPRPEFNLGQDGSTGSLEATFAAAVAILGLLCTAEVVEDGCFSYRRFVSGVHHRKWKKF